MLCFHFIHSFDIFSIYLRLWWCVDEASVANAVGKVRHLYIFWICSGYEKYRDRGQGAIGAINKELSGSYWTSWEDPSAGSLVGHSVQLSDFV
ncbi:hypothetical protein BDR22DRAFT_579462 [Usnea florida]